MTSLLLPAGSSTRPDPLVLVTALPVAVLAGALVMVDAKAALLLGLTAGVAVTVFFRPAAGAYLLVGLTPLVAGIDRGRLIPGARPNEALLALVLVVVVVRHFLVDRLRGPVRLRGDAFAVVIVAMAAASSVLPMAWLAVRAQPITSEDVLHAVVLWKYLALYLVVRATIRTEREARVVVWVLLASASVVCLIAILQSMNLFGVPGLLATYYAPYGNASALSIRRGSSTLAQSFATADLAIYSLALAVGLATRGIGRRPVVAGVAVLLLLGVFASGQFSAVIGLLVALVALLAVSRRRKVFLALLPLLAVAPVLLRPVVEKRLSGFSSVSGWPESWVGRYNNLRGYFWPELAADNNFLLGVRPNARVAGPHDLGIDWVWIESGYMWLLWGGGLPLLIAYVAFTAVVLVRSWRPGRDDDGICGAVATSVFTGSCVLVVLMVLDPHLTYRGAADAYFALLAVLAATLWIRPPMDVPLAPATSPTTPRGPR